MNCLLPLLLLLLLSIPTTISASSPFPPGSLPTTSGYLPITPNTTAGGGDALYFAFYEAQQPLTPPSSTPILVWLQGGPGCSSLKANFFELGPFLVAPGDGDGDGQPLLRPNPYTWNRRFALLFIDNPLGTGFSYTPSPSAIPRDQPTIARHLHAALKSFLTSHPTHRRRPLFLTGNSYGGKYAPAAAHLILRLNRLSSPSLRINLAGVVLGNGMTHPISQVTTHAAVAYYAGLINDRQRAHLELLQNQAISHILASNWTAATEVRTGLVDWLQNAAGLATVLDFTKLRPYQDQLVGVFINTDEVRAALRAKKGMVWQRCSKTVKRALREDLMKSVKFAVEELLRVSRVLLYQGPNDLISGPAATEAWVKEIEWEGLGEFLAAERKVWKVDGERAGYVQRWGSLTHAVVSGAGHIATVDQRRNVQAMIEDWVLEQGVFGNQNGPQAEKDPGFRSSY